MKSTIFYNNDYTDIIILDPETTPEECEENHNHIHIANTSQYLGCKNPQN